MLAIKPIGNSNVASSRLRAFLPVEHLRKAGVDIEIYKPENQSKYNAIIFQKAYTESDIEIATRSKDSGKTVILDQCDNHFIFDKENKMLLERADRMKQMASISDALLVSTKEIAKLYPQKTTVVVPDYIEIPKARLVSCLKADLKYRNCFNPTNIKLVWFGNSGSSNPKFGMCDIAEKIPVLNDVSTHYKIQLSVISNSEEKFKHFFKKKCQFQVNYIKWKEDNFYRLLKKHDICLLPIGVNPFTICKTNNRITLSILAGLPTLADEIPSYSEFREYVRFGNWIFNIKQMIENLPEENLRAQKGIDYINTKYSEQAITQHWIRALETLRII